MVEIAIRVHNLTVATALVRQISASGATWGRTRIRAGSPLVYARGIETGRQRDGTVARKAGGAFMFKKGIEKLKAFIKAGLPAAVIAGPTAVEALARSASTQLVSFVQEETPVVSGDLRKSVFAGPE